MITVIILTKNSARTLEKTLNSLKNFSEVLIIDNGSTDHTLEIARKFSNVTVHEKTFTTFGKLRNESAKLASNDWILALDSDEALSPELSKEILSLTPDPKKLFNLPFHNFFKGKQVKCCGWYPESHPRLYNRKVTAFKEDHVHESLEIKGLKLITLKNPVLHTPYFTQEDFLRKLQLYTSCFAAGTDKPSSFSKALFHAAFAFFKSYFLKKGIFYGETGFTLSLYNANTAFYKYMKLKEKHELNASLPPRTR